MPQALSEALLAVLRLDRDPALPPEDPWARLHRLLRGRPRTLWRRLPAPSPFPAPHATAWRAAHALAMVAFPLLPDEGALMAVRERDRFVLRRADVPSAHGRMILEAAIAPALERLARTGGAHPPDTVEVRRVRTPLDRFLHQPPRPEISVRLRGHASRMTFGLDPDGSVRHASWSSP